MRFAECDTIQALSEAMHLSGASSARHKRQCGIFVTRSVTRSVECRLSREAD